MTREFDWIRSVRGSVPAGKHVSTGIGDDTAVLDVTSLSNLLITTDMLIDGRHFLVGTHEPERIGRKVLAVNLSDIAAMAGRPLACTLAIAIPSGLPTDFLPRFHAGFMAMANEFGVALVGGDTNRTDGPLTASVTLFGDCNPHAPVLRSGAQDGDGIFVTGALGGSLAGHHLDFTPRVREALQFREGYAITSMIDISDGLASDLRHVLNESDVGAVIEAESIPVSESLIDSGESAIPRALGDGEDFELLFTLPGELCSTFMAESWSCRVTQIGRIQGRHGLRLRDSDGSEREIDVSGFEHCWESGPENASEK